MINVMTVRACGHCGQLIGNGTYIALNGEYLCWKCLSDMDVLNDFLAKGSKAAHTFAASLLGGVRV